MDSYLVRKERCPKCASQGKDNSKDNLGVYSDNHSYCFSCGFTIPASGISKFLAGSSSTREKFGHERPLDKREHRLSLPEDCDTTYPNVALEWIKQYGLTRNDLLSQHVLWSSSTSRLIFPIYDSTSGLVAYQGRYFGAEAPEGTKPYPKWHGRGDLKNTFNLLGQSSNQIVLVEDIISAIKLSKITRAMPLYGSFVGSTRFKRLRTILEKDVEVCVWLDPDKRAESIVEARRGTLAGLTTRVIYSSADPKEHSMEEIKSILTGS